MVAVLMGNVVEPAVAAIVHAANTRMKRRMVRMSQHKSLRTSRDRLEAKP